MAYPDYVQYSDSTEEVVDDVQIDRATNGMARGRATFTDSKRRFLLRHHMLTSDEIDALLAFYEANRTGTFLFTWQRNGLQYSEAFFAARPRFSNESGENFSAEVTLET